MTSSLASRARQGIREAPPSITAISKPDIRDPPKDCPTLRDLAGRRRNLQSALTPASLKKSVKSYRQGALDDAIAHRRDKSACGDAQERKQ
jgi:hypothetical protein